MSACIDVLKKPPESPSKTCHFSFFVAQKLAQMDKRSRMIAVKRITDVIYYIEMNNTAYSTISPGYGHGSSISYNGTSINTGMQMNNPAFLSYLES